MLADDDAVYTLRQSPPYSIPGLPSATQHNIWSKGMQKLKTCVGCLLADGRTRRPEEEVVESSSSREMFTSQCLLITTFAAAHGQ